MVRVPDVGIAEEDDGAAASSSPCAVVTGVGASQTDRGVPTARVARSDDLKTISCDGGGSDEDDTAAFTALAALIVILVAAASPTAHKSPHSGGIEVATQGHPSIAPAGVRHISARAPPPTAASGPSPLAASAIVRAAATPCVVIIPAPSSTG
jgi:hypothetical protein